MNIKEYENFAIIVAMFVLAMIALLKGNADIVSVIIGALGGYLGAKHIRTNEQTDKKALTE